ncbi:aminoglycoside phosphotransferase family protein [Luedemannella flava]|uniref:Aminoglycoside phosphotransferase family protein n=1 Tax=Luedemannella flava TaxID=349316 RepID=A0ABP4Y2A5_9ACTN
MATRLSLDEQSRLRAGLSAVCRQVSLDPDDAVLIKYTMNAVFHLHHADVVLRLATGPTAAERVDRVVRVGVAFAELDAPTIRLAAGLPNPVHAGEWSASIWQAVIDDADRRWAPVDLTGPLRAIHAIKQAPTTVPTWDPVGKSRRRLADLSLLADSEQRFMHSWAQQVGRSLAHIVDHLGRWCDDLESALLATEWALPVGVIHGDAHTGNLLATSDGHTVLGDLDSVAIGPREWDLVPAAHGAHRFARSRADYTSFATTYGVDVTTLPGWDILRQTRELQLVTSVIASLAGRPAVADELAHRMRTILTGSHTATWHRYQ